MEKITSLFTFVRMPYSYKVFFFYRQGMIALKMGPFWPGLIATFLASLVTMTSTMKSNGGCESDDDHFYLIKHRSKRDYDGLSIGGQSY